MLLRLAAAALAAALALPAAALTQAETDALVKLVDQRQRSSGDYKALCYMESKERDKTDVVYELVVYRREAEEKLSAYAAHKLLLTVKEGVDVAFPRVRLWIDAATGNVLKRQELALSG